MTKMKFEIVGYLCKNCGKDIGTHKAGTLNCRVKGRNSFRGFEPDKVYEENLKKPVYGFKL